MITTINLRSVILTTGRMTSATMATIACTPPGSTLPATLDNRTPPTRDVWSPFFHLSYLNHSITVGVYFNLRN